MLINRWLSAKEGDGQIVRDLNLHQQIPGKIFLVLITNPLSANPKKWATADELFECF